MPDINKPQWTQGDWVALSASGKTADPLMIVASAPCWVKGSKLIASGFSMTEPDATANLQLIAAAPDLYAAVEAALNMVDGDGAPPRWDILRAALAKARGEKP
jgi:hypothetical protein